MNRNTNIIYSDAHRSYIANFYFKCDREMQTETGNPKRKDGRTDNRCTIINKEGGK